MKKIYIISGEASGDLHSANLVSELKKQNNSLEFRAWGGDRLRNEGVTIDKDINELAFMGFLEVLLNLKTILRNIRSCKKNLLDFKPDLLILVDYPGFNLRIAKWAKSQKIPVYYYISPQIWAWKESRIHRIKQSVSRMYCILPFEKDFYMKHSLNVSYLGHPLLDEVNKFKILNNNSLELTIDKDNHTITMNSSYTYDIDFLDQWQALINDYKTQYLEACENNEGAVNDIQLFDNFDNMISVLRQELK